MMRRDVTKKNFTKRRARRRWVLAAVLLTFLVTAGAGLWVADKKHWVDFSQLTVSLSRGSRWALENKNRLEAKLANNVEKVKRMAAAKNPENDEIHFEFYTALQNMQMPGAKAAVPAKEEAVTPKAQAVSPKAQAVSTTAQATPVSDANGDIKPAAEKKADKIFMNPEELARDFSRSLIREAYVIQAGVFSSREAAETYAAELEKDGYPADINKMTNTQRDLYKVQVGPFVSKDKAVSVQAQLEQKGIQCVLRTIELT